MITEYMVTSYVTCVFLMYRIYLLFIYIKLLNEYKNNNNSTCYIIFITRVYINIVYPYLLRLWKEIYTKSVINPYNRLTQNGYVTLVKILEKGIGMQSKPSKMTHPSSTWGTLAKKYIYIYIYIYIFLQQNNIRHRLLSPVI